MIHIKLNPELHSSEGGDVKAHLPIDHVASVWIICWQGPELAHDPHKLVFG